VVSGLGAVYLYASPYFASRTGPLSEPARSAEDKAPQTPQTAPTARPPTAVAATEPASPERPTVAEAKPPDATPTAPAPAVVLNKGAHDRPSPVKERGGKAAAANAERLARAPVEDTRGEASDDRRSTRGYRRARVQDRTRRPPRKRLAREAIEYDPPPPSVDIKDYESLRANVLRNSLRSPD